MKKMEIAELNNFSDAEVSELMRNGYKFRHKSLEEYISEAGGVLKVSEELDWGKSVGREIW